MHEVIGPNVVCTGWRQWWHAAASNPSAWFAARYLERCGAPDALYPFDIDHATLSAHQRPCPSVAITRMALGNGLQLCLQYSIAPVEPTLVV
jgi:hypothetical protein